MLGSCFSTNWLIMVKKDGSGTITMDFTMDQSVMGMMQGMGGGGDAPAQTGADLINADDLSRLARAMGEGVRYVSAEPADKGGNIGYKATFAFDDISKVHIDPMLGAPSDGDESEEVEADDVISFAFKKGSRPQLTIITDQSENNSDTEDYSDTESEAQSPEEAAAMANMMKPFLGSMSFSVLVKVDGAISSTNASYVNGSTVTMMDFDMGKIIDNNDLFTKVMADNSMEDEEVRKELAKNGVLIELQEKVTVDFR